MCPVQCATYVSGRSQKKCSFQGQRIESGASSVSLVSCFAARKGSSSAMGFFRETRAVSGITARPFLGARANLGARTCRGDGSNGTGWNHWRSRSNRLSGRGWRNGCRWGDRPNRSNGSDRADRSLSQRRIAGAGTRSRLCSHEKQKHRHRMRDGADRNFSGGLADSLSVTRSPRLKNGLTTQD